MSTQISGLDDKLKNKKIIAWGASKLLEFYCKNSNSYPIAYAIDSNPELHGKRVCGIEVKSPQALIDEDMREIAVVVFVVSNVSIQEILKTLNHWGGLLHNSVFLYSDLFYESFCQRLGKILNRRINYNNYNFVKSFSLSTSLQIHTTLLGNLLFLELLSEIQKKNKKFSIAELGIFHGGNALLALLWLTQNRDMLQDPSFYLFDSFEGFPVVSRFDPKDKKKGDYSIEGSFENILNYFSLYPNVQVIKGFVPGTFSQLDRQNKYHMVFYDCDLYEPALATFDYFWEKIVPGGYLLIHDYVAEDGGYHGVKKATDEYFKNKNVSMNVFWENTTALIVKK